MKALRYFSSSHQPFGSFNFYFLLGLLFKCCFSRLKYSISCTKGIQFSSWVLPLVGSLTLPEFQNQRRVSQVIYFYPNVAWESFLTFISFSHTIQMSRLVSSKDLSNFTLKFKFFRMYCVILDINHIKLDQPTALPPIYVFFQMSP